MHIIIFQTCVDRFELEYKTCLFCGYGCTILLTVRVKETLPNMYPNPVMIAMLEPTIHVCVSSCCCKSGNRTLKLFIVPTSINMLNVATARTINDLPLSLFVISVCYDIKVLFTLNNKSSTLSSNCI